jgi:threonine/homoserine/homoserine lactone efflux protein
MSAQTWWAFCLFAFVSSVTPGPNNLMLLASGVNFGLRATVPHIFGIAAGFAALLIAVGLGLAEVFQRWPWLYIALKWVGAAYLLHLAWVIARAGRPQELGRARPMAFHAAALFQCVNPKAWIMAVSAFATYVQVQDAAAVVQVALCFVLIGLPSSGFWALVGSRLRNWLAEGRRQAHFNGLMGGLLVLSLWPILGARL